MIQIPKLKFGDPRSIEWCFDMAEKLKLLKRSWIDGQGATATSCAVCNREITSDQAHRTDGAIAIHAECLEDLRDLAVRSGGGAECLIAA